MKSCDICRSAINVAESSYRVGADKVRTCARNECLDAALQGQKDARLAELIARHNETNDNTETKETAQ